MTDLEAQLAATRRDLRDAHATIHQLVNENRDLRARLAASRSKPANTPPSRFTRGVDSFQHP